MFGAITLKLVVDALSDLPVAVGVASLQTVKEQRCEPGGMFQGKQC